MADQSRDTLLIQFAREPVPGQVKTRMQPQLTASEACSLHCDLVLWTARQLLAARLGPLQMAVTGDRENLLFTQCLSMGVAEVVQQRGADLGERMFRALSDGLRSFARVILVGSDCPSIGSDYLAAALDSLERVSLVVGPAQDGGYVLLGASRIERELFEGISWGSDQVMSQTRARLAKLGWKFEQLPVLADVDRPEDIPAWEGIRNETA